MIMNTKHRYLKNVATLKVDKEKCIGCGKCTEVCPHKVFELKARKAEIIEIDACMECGGCAINCPSKAIEVKQGVGCVYAVIMGWLTGSEPSCDCSSTQQNQSCCDEKPRGKGGGCC